MSKHYYQNQPDYAFWRRAITEIHPDDIDPVSKCPFQILRSDRIATAGSCFAQHISRHLRANNFNYFVTEKPHPIVPKHLISTYNYGVYSARYGNIYTSRQLLQLLLRAYDEFHPKIDLWNDQRGRLIDPYRPQIQPDGFSTEEGFWADRLQHFARVRQMFSELDVFIFTLGLTECWASCEDGAVFPLCPGVAGGTFDSNKYQLINLGVEEVVNDVVEFFNYLTHINPNAKLILTVSPVPLMATAEDQHVLTATTYSKSVLRVASELIVKKHPDRISYFPAYEIVTGNFSRGRYFADDLRSINEAGVNHVMRVFLKNFGGIPLHSQNKKATYIDRPEYAHIKEMSILVKANCDEELLDEECHFLDKKIVQGKIENINKFISFWSAEGNSYTTCKEIDFTKAEFPSFVSSVTGLSIQEKWGRWSDTVDKQAIIFQFDNYLPRNFKLEFFILAYGPNIGMPIKVVSSNVIKTFCIDSQHATSYSLIFENVNGANAIEIIPPKPTRPKDLITGNLDSRFLGLGFISMKLIPLKKI